MRKFICRTCDNYCEVPVIRGILSIETIGNIKKKGWVLNFSRPKKSLCPDCNIFEIGENPA